jgi:hypothetical protein
MPEASHSPPRPGSVRRPVRRFLGLALVAGLGAALLPGRGAEVTDEQVLNAIGDIRAWLLERQLDNGTWPFAGYDRGHTALVLLALNQAGLPSQHPAMQRGIAAVLRGSDDKVYSEALVATLLEQLDPVQYQPRILQAGQYLTNAQNGDKGWGYGTRNGSDASNSQFAVLGLAAAERCGFEVPAATRQQALRYWTRLQANDGGWPYNLDAKNASTFSMTCAGIASLYLLGVPLEKPGNRCGEYVYSKQIAAGVDWLGDAFRNRRGLPAPEHYWGLYGFYALERVAIFLDLKAIAGVDWYRWGARQLVGRNLQDVTGQAFILLFLAKAATPVAIAKWEWQGDWENDHADVRTWVAEAGKAMGQRLDWLSAALSRRKSKVLKASLIFVNGHGQFTVSPEEIGVLRAFLDQGGTVVAEGCCQSARFSQSFKQEMKLKLYPGGTADFAPIEAGHAVYSAFHSLGPEDIVIDQLKLSGCKKARIFVLGRDLSCALNGERPAAEQEKAVRIATNLLAFAFESKKPRGKLDEVDEPELKPETTRLSVDDIARPPALAGRRYEQPFGRLRHRGDWLADPSFFPNLQAQLLTDPHFPQFDAEIYLDPAADGLFDVPVLFLNGHDSPDLRDVEWLNLRRYLERGGFLLVSACCGSRSFDNGFRQLLVNALPNDKLEPIPKTDPLYRAPFNLTGEPAQGTRAYQARYQAAWADLLGVRREGRWIVVYSPVDFCCALEDDLDEQNLAYARDSALRLAMNIVAYAMNP